jgi:hypothetical protein
MFYVRADENGGERDGADGAAHSQEPSNHAAKEAECHVLDDDL